MNGISTVISTGWDIDAVLENGRRSERFIMRQDNAKAAVTEIFTPVTWNKKGFSRAVGRKHNREEQVR